MTDDRPLELERFVPYRLSLLSNTLSQAIAREYQARFGLSVTEWRVLAVLGRYAGLSAGEVAERTAMDKVAVSRAVARLLGDDRIRRAVHRGDRRRSVLALTPKGQRIYDQIAPRALEYERQLLQVLDAEEREWLERLLAKLTGDGLEAVRRIPLPRAGGAR
jgi:DNA-binding MarR family transcriptional regulator